MNEYEQLSLYYNKQSNIIAIVVGLVTFLSLFAFYIDYRYRKNKERAEKSINLAEEFAKSIVPKLAIIYNYFENSMLDKIISQVKFTRFIDFDSQEAHELYLPEDIKKYKDILLKNNIIEIDNKKINIEDLIILILNELEHMCMYISTKVADGKYIYNSLHQQFFKSISLLYMSISLININNKDKYYTNIIHVYNLWVKKYIKYDNKEKKFKDKLKPKNPRI